MGHRHECNAYRYIQMCIDMCVVSSEEKNGAASSVQHHRGDGPTSSHGHVSMGKGQGAVCSGGLVVVVETTVLLKLGLSPEPGLKKQTLRSKVLVKEMRFRETTGVWIGAVCQRRRGGGGGAVRGR